MIVMNQMKLTSFWSGGIGMHSLLYLLCILNGNSLWATHSQVFPNYMAASRPISQNSALSRIKAKRAAEKEARAGGSIS